MTPPPSPEALIQRLREPTAKCPVPTKPCRTRFPPRQWCDHCAQAAAADALASSQEALRYEQQARQTIAQQLERRAGGRDELTRQLTERAEKAEEALRAAERDRDEALAENARVHAEYDAFLADHGHDGCTAALQAKEQEIAQWKQAEEAWRLRAEQDERELAALRKQIEAARRVVDVALASLPPE